MADLLLAPYLPLRETVTVGRWTLVPFVRLAATTPFGEGVADAATRLVDAYRTTDDLGSTLGAVVYPAGGQVGDVIDRGGMSLLRRALLAGVIADNPHLVREDGEQDGGGNAGRARCTTESAALCGHPNITTDTYVLQIGVLAKTLTLTHAEPDEPFPTIPAPLELPRGKFAKFDEEVAAATYAAMGSDDVAGRRLARALDWYAVAFSNSESVSHDVRVGAARSALEVLTDSGSASKKLVRAVGRLLRDADTPAVTRESEHWNGPVQLTEDEWWLSGFCSLRNAIVHGDDIADPMWLHEGQHHLDHAHDQLIRVLKRIVATSSGDPNLVLAVGERVSARMADEMYRRLTENDSC